MRRLIFCSLLCLIAVSVNATNWVDLGNNRYIDTDSVSIFDENAQIATAFFKDDNLSKLKLKSKNIAVDSMRSKLAFNCKDETSFVVSVVEYDAKQIPIHSFSRSIYGPFDVIHPETIMDNKMKVVCIISGFKNIDD